MTLEEAEAWRSRKRAGTERPGGRVVVRSDRGGSVLHVEASGREPFEVYPGKVDFLGSEIYDVAVTVEVVDAGDEAPTVDVTEVAFRARPDGQPLSARGIQSVNVGALMGRAVDALGEAVDSEGQRVKVAAGEHLRRAMARSATTANRGRPRYTADELRFFAQAYLSAPERGKYAAIREAYKKDGRWCDLDGHPPKQDALRYRRTVAGRRDDPTTGEKFLPPAS